MSRRVVAGVLVCLALTSCESVSSEVAPGGPAGMLVTGSDLGAGWLEAGPGIDGRLGWSAAGGQAAPFSKCVDVPGPEFMKPFSELETLGKSFAQVNDAGAVSVSSRVYPASGPSDADALLAARECVVEFARMIASQEASRIGSGVGTPVEEPVGAGGDLRGGIRGLHLTIPLYPAGGEPLSADVVVLVGSSGDATAVYSLYSVGAVFDGSAVDVLVRLLSQRISSFA